MKQEWQAIGLKLGHKFSDISLLQQALTHRSYSSRNNERFEFLGDALLETIISNYLFHNFPKISEGELTRLRAQVVKGDTLAIIAKSLELGTYIRLGDGERKSGGHRRDSILADALEALIAAIYLDSDFINCEKYVLNLFTEQLNQLNKKNLNFKDSKTLLQEFLQARGLPLPVYTIVKESGPDHQRVFEVLAVSEHHQALASASSRKKAEQNAAAILLKIYTGENNAE